MFCPRCGAESEEGVRYCASCGSELPKDTDPSSSESITPPDFRQRLRRLIGSDRRARLLTAGTVIAFAIAIAAFVALRPSDDGSAIPQDSYTKALDTACIQHKGKIAAAQREALGGGGLVVVSRYGDSLAAIAGEWHMELEDSPPPANRTELVEKLKSALLEVEIEAGTLARVARESNRRGVAKTAVQVDTATENVEMALASLQLERCAALTVDQGRLAQQ
jgi:hypothetical protein